MAEKFGTVEYFKSLGLNTADATKEVKKYAKSVVEAGSAADKATPKFKSMGAALNDLNFGYIDKPLKLFSDLSEKTDELLGKLGPVGGLLNGVKTAMGFVADATLMAFNGFEQFSKNVDKVAISINQSFGGSVGETKKYLNEFEKSFIGTKNATLQTLEEITKDASKLGTLYKAETMFDTKPYQALADSIGMPAKSLHGLSSAFLVAKGAGIEQSKAIDVVTDITIKLSNSTKSAGQNLFNATQALTSFSAVSKGTGVNVDYVRESVMNSVNTVALYRDGATSAATTVENLSSATGTFAGALTKVGVAGVEAIRFAQKFTNTLENTGIAQRAFIAQTGGMAKGMGALSASLQYEKAIGEGKFEDIQEALSEAVKKVGGGKIMTFDEAAAGGESEARTFEMQRKIVGQMTGSQDATQNRRILDILSGGGRMDRKDFGADQVGKSTRQGIDVQRETVTALDRVIKSVEVSGGLIFKEVGDSVGSFHKENVDLLSKIAKTSSDVISGKKGIEEGGAEIAKGVGQYGGRMGGSIGRMGGRIVDQAGGFVEGAKYQLRGSKTRPEITPDMVPTKEDASWAHADTKRVQDIALKNQGLDKPELKDGLGLEKLGAIVGRLTDGIGSASDVSASDVIDNFKSFFKDMQKAEIIKRAVENRVEGAGEKRDIYKQGIGTDPLPKFLEEFKPRAEAANLADSAKDQLARNQESAGGAASGQTIYVKLDASQANELKIALRNDDVDEVNKKGPKVKIKGEAIDDRTDLKAVWAVATS